MRPHIDFVQAQNLPWQSADIVDRPSLSLKLLSQDLLRNARHFSPERSKMLRRFRKPIDNYQLPFSADRGQGGGQWTPTDRVGAAAVT